MRHFIVAAVVLIAAATHAQSVDVTFGGLHAGVRAREAEVDIDGPAPLVVMQYPVPGVDPFSIGYSMSPEARLVVTQPEGLAAQVWSDRLEGQFVVPFSWAGRPGLRYRVILFGVDGAPVFDRQVELRAFKQLTLSLLHTAPVVAVHRHRAAMAQPPAAAGMPAADFAALLSLVEEQGFSSDKLGAISAAIDGGVWFTCAQVGQLVDLLSMSQDKVQVVALARGRLVDPNNGFSLLRRFSFSSDKERVRDLLGR